MIVTFPEHTHRFVFVVVYYCCFRGRIYTNKLRVLLISQKHAFVHFVKNVEVKNH